MAKGFLAVAHKLIWFSARGRYAEVDVTRSDDETKTLIDEYEFVVHPRLAGHGPTLFAGLTKHVDLKLFSRLEFASGAVAMRYGGEKVAKGGLLKRVLGLPSDEPPNQPLQRTGLHPAAERRYRYAASPS